jgi:hypothetical protein
LLPLFFTFALEYAIWNVHEKQEELSGTHQFLAYADDIDWAKT